MAIIIEGMDATGKSTLGRYLASRFNLRIQESEGPPRSPTEIYHRVDRYNHMVDTLFVRHPCVSQNIYNICHPDPLVLDVGDFYQRGHTFIYCAEPSQHIPKPGEDSQFIEAVERNRPALLHSYNDWALKRAHIIYRIGDDPARIADMIQPHPDPVADIAAFHERFSNDYDGPPRHLPPDLRQFRETFLLEEVTEYCRATSLHDRFDALLDIVYVALGACYLHGLPFYRGWPRVHAANMLKVRAASPDDSLRKSIYDVVKPPGWEAPDLTDLCEP